MVPIDSWDFTVRNLQEQLVIKVEDLVTIKLMGKYFKGFNSNLKLEFEPVKLVELLELKVILMVIKMVRID